MESLLEKDLSSLVIDDLNYLKKIEVLVVIDGATDRSSEIAHSFQNKYPDTFKVIDKENGNYGSCINRGLKEATGKYVKIMDADDSYCTLNIPDYLDALENTDADLILNDYKMVFDDGTDWLKVRYNLPVKKCINVCDIKSKSIISELVLHSIAYKKNIFDDLKYHQTEGISYTDQEWIIIPMRNVKTLLYFNEDIYLYLCGRQGQTIETSFSEKGIIQHLEVLNSIGRVYSNFISQDYPSKFIVEYKIQALASRIYLNCIKSGNDDCIKQLTQLDLYFKENYTEFYQLLEKAELSRFVPVCFVKWWRKNNMPNELSLKFYFYSKIDKYLAGVERRLIKNK